MSVNQTLIIKYSFLSRHRGKKALANIGMRATWGGSLNYRSKSNIKFFQNVTKRRKFPPWELQGKMISDCWNKLCFPEAEECVLRREAAEW